MTCTRSRSVNMPEILFSMPTTTIAPIFFLLRIAAASETVVFGPVVTTSRPFRSSIALTELAIWTSYGESETLLGNTGSAAVSPPIAEINGALVGSGLQLVVRPSLLEILLRRLPVEERKKE